MHKILYYKKVNNLNYNVIEYNFSINNDTPLWGIYNLI